MDFLAGTVRFHHRLFQDAGSQVGVDGFAEGQFLLQKAADALHIQRIALRSLFRLLGFQLPLQNFKLGITAVVSGFELLHRQSACNAQLQKFVFFGMNGGHFPF